MNTFNDETMEEIRKTNGRVYKLGDFEGPLDLLLFLIKKSEINIYDIPIAEITDQYLAFLSYQASMDLDNLSEFHLMAANLLYIKSRMLLPVEIEFDDDFEDPRMDLVEKLIEYQKFKKYTDLMAEKEKESEWDISRTKQQRTLPFPENDDLWEQIDVWDLVQTFSKIISSLSSERIIDLYEEVTIHEKLTLIREFLESKEEFLFTDLISKSGSILEIVCSFFALLEAVKSRMVVLLQNRLFGDIRIRKP